MLIKISSSKEPESSSVSGFLGSKAGSSNSVEASHSSLTCYEQYTMGFSGRSAVLEVESTKDFTGWLFNVNIQQSIGIEVVAGE